MIGVGSDKKIKYHFHFLAQSLVTIKRSIFLTKSKSWYFLIRCIDSLSKAGSIRPGTGTNRGFRCSIFFLSSHYKRRFLISRNQKVQIQTQVGKSAASTSKKNRLQGNKVVFAIFRSFHEPIADEIDGGDDGK